MSRSVRGDFKRVEPGGPRAFAEDGFEAVKGETPKKRSPPGRMPIQGREDLWRKSALMYADDNSAVEDAVLSWGPSLGTKLQAPRAIIRAWAWRKNALSDYTQQLRRPRVCVKG